MEKKDKKKWGKRTRRNEEKDKKNGNKVKGM